MVKTIINKERRRDKYLSDVKDVLIDFKLLIKKLSTKIPDDLLLPLLPPHLSFP